MTFRPPTPATVTELAPKLGRMSVRVLLALRSPMECNLLASAFKRFSRQVHVVAKASSKEGVLRCLSGANIDVALISAELDGGLWAGLELLHQLRLPYPNTRVVILFDKWQDDLVVHAFRAGARGVFCRSEAKVEILKKCIKAVHHGQIWANSGQLELLLNTLARVAPIHIPKPGMNLLTEREVEVANLVGEGLANREIASKLGVNEHTVNNYLFRIYNKIGLSNRVELAICVMKSRQEDSICAQGPVSA